MSVQHTLARSLLGGMHTAADEDHVGKLDKVALMKFAKELGVRTHGNRNWRLVFCY